MEDDTQHPEMRIEEEMERVVDQTKELQEAARSLISKSSREEKDLQQRARSLYTSMDELRSSIISLTFDGHMDHRLAEKVLH